MVVKKSILSSQEIVIVGAGLYGSIIARELAEVHNKKVTIIEKRDHIGGNCFDERDQDTNILTHRYGPHIFHTSMEDVWAYVNQYTEFNDFQFNYMAQYKDKIYPLPFNLALINQFYDVNLKPCELEKFMAKEHKKEYYENPKNLEEQSISLIGRPLYEAFIKGYVAKQWEKDPKDLPASIIKRLPVRNNYNSCYYFDTHIAMPKYGYAHMFKNILDHKNITIKLNTDYFEVRDSLSDDVYTIYTGPIDRYFNYKLGKLEYRTVTFQKELHNVQDYQGTILMSYVEEQYPYTRICEPKHFYPNSDEFINNQTVVYKEFSKFDDGNNPFYPINNETNQALANKYKEETKKLKNIHFGGRLAQYEYLDMDKSIKQALDFLNNLQER